jgi:hypothetical protein
VNDSEHELRDEGATAEEEPIDRADAYESVSDAPQAGLNDLVPAAANRIRLFMAESIIRGGASPADVADLYTSQEIVDDDESTAYLDRRFVHGEVLSDWREFQDRLTSAYLDGRPGVGAEALLSDLELFDARRDVTRSIFDDPDEDELIEELRTVRIEDRDPLLSDLSHESRRAIERYILADVLSYGVAPIKVMSLREGLRSDGDERALQYLDLPFELGDRPTDWDRLRDRALMVRARLERLGVDSERAYAQVDMSHPDANASEMLTILEEQDQRR